MKWSFSKSRMFLRCPRKLYYSAILASATAKDPIRREAYILKQLQSLSAWRGSLVDKIIEELILPRLKSKILPTEGEVAAFAARLISRQVEFGKAQKHRDLGFTKSKAGDSYCAFYDIEYNGVLDEGQLFEAEYEAGVALRNLVQSELVKKVMFESSYIIAQRSLTFKFADVTISCTPDLVAFFPNEAPLIVDWKVHSFANADSWLQLGIYAYALSKVKLHKDFPAFIQGRLRDPTEFRLIEYQLLKNEQRSYSLEDSDIADIEDYMFRSWTQMNRLINGRKLSELSIRDFPTARSPDVCVRCPFRKPCWGRRVSQTTLVEE